MTEVEIYNGLQSVFDTVFRRRDIKLTPELSAADVPGWIVSAMSALSSRPRKLPLIEARADAVITSVRFV
jgi:hypothetical protein